MTGQAAIHAIRLGVPEVRLEVIQVVKVRTTRGCGMTYCTAPHEHQIIREVVQYFDLAGGFLAEHDTWPSGESIV